ncbi:MAG: DUF5320 domain-containing protein [Anaerolineae bacterium]|nr:DUF5320 domain-containing protein [Anaerolineae bacterium]
MPRFDGTGPRGQGPMTGRGEGHCALVLPSSGKEDAPYGYAGLQGTPVRLGTPALWPPVWRGVVGWLPMAMRLGRAFGRGRGRRRGRWFIDR